MGRSPAIAAVTALGVVAVAALALFALPAKEVSLTYRDASPAAQLLGIGAGAALVVATLLKARGAIALLVLALAAVWFAQDLTALGDSGALLRSIAGGAAPFAAALALHVALALPEGRLSRAGRAGVAAAYLAAAVTAAGMLTTRDPFRDVYCWQECGDNPLLVHASPALARGFVVAGLVSSIAIGAVAIVVVVRRLSGASRVGRSLLAPALIPAGLVAASEAARGAALLLSPLEDPRRAGFMAVYLLRAGALVALAAGVAWTVLRKRGTRARMTRLAAELGAAPPPGKLRDALRTALGDPTLDVLYAVPGAGAGGFVDAEGALRAVPGAPATRVTRGG